MLEKVKILIDPELERLYLESKYPEGFPMDIELARSYDEHKRAVEGSICLEEKDGKTLE